MPTSASPTAVSATAFSPKPASTTGPSSAAPVVVRTSAGAVRGTRLGGVTEFLGVPYAQPPVGPLRFASPRPPQPWTAVRDATTRGAQFCQPGVPGSAEDALSANVWTPDEGGSLPVLVYVHGGAWQVGAGSLANYDGALLAAEGGLVVVTFNYRLGPFGFGFHEELADVDTGLHANWGLQDQMALLHWVRDNAPAFGGDPGNVTLVGTSAGGASAHQLALLPQTKVLVRRVVEISAAHVRAPQLSMTAPHARASAERLADRLGTTVPGLRQAPASVLLAAWNELGQNRPAHSGREFRGPVLDGTTMPGYDHDSPPPDMPVMSVHTRNEGTFFTVPGMSVLTPTPPPATFLRLRGVVRDILRALADDVSEYDVQDCLQVYRDAAALGAFAHDPATVWSEVYGDALLRHRVVRLAERHVRIGRSPLYAMEFTHPTRVPGVGAPHEATSKFLFGTHATPANIDMFGDGPLERRVGTTLRQLVASFATTGHPSCADGPAWPALDEHGHGSLVLGGPDLAVVGRVERSERLRFWDRPGLAPWPTPHHARPRAAMTPAERVPAGAPPPLTDRRNR
ncbi:carboxylesterase/lipase family protein [Actinokineospora globicatena]|uniref:carboxylesterase/lipase family protein n=1 Tax=Actinokineospora globicatena TaxID=103729 RepID=UPI0020A255D5|nr:carboxylesterase family protein [Actinokineospora globicatena]MCP2303155.1 para-nitrobenzyl esterase [Actinokineospora globicatena]